MRNLILIAGCCALLFLAACDSNNDDNNVLNIGIVLPLTGTLQHAGTGVQRGMELGRDALNDSGRLGDTKLMFITKDNASTVDGSGAAFNELINEERVPVIVGPLTSSATSHITSTVNDAGVVAFSPSSAADGLGAKSKWLFRSSLTIEHLVPTGIAVSKRHLNYRRVATIFNNGDTYSKSSHSKITEVLNTDTDLSIISERSYSRPPGTPIGDLSTELNAILSANPDAIFISGQPEDQIGIITQGHTLGIADTPYISPLLGIPEVRKSNEAVAGSAEKAITFQIWLVSSTNAVNKAFVSSYSARHGEVPDDWAARGYAAMQILGAALANADSYQAAVIQSAMAKTSGLATIFGSFSFDEHGDAVYDPVVAQVQNGEFVILE